MHMPQQEFPTPSGLMMSGLPPANGSNAYTGLRTPAAAANSLHLQQPNMPQASDYLPSISPSVMYAHAVWTAQEMHLLHQGLLEFPTDKYDNVTQYIKIAATIPGKSVRDVAFKVKTLSLALQDKHIGDSVQFPKRVKIEQYHEQMPKCVSVMPLSGSDLMEEAQLNALLQDNMFAINTMRANLINGKPEANREPMVAFRDNCHNVLNAYVFSCMGFF